MANKEKELFSNALGAIWHLAEEFYIIGFVVGAILAACSFYAFDAVHTLLSGDSLLSQALKNVYIGYLLYVMPLIIFSFSYIFFNRAMISFMERR